MLRAALAAALLALVPAGAARGDALASAQSFDGLDVAGGQVAYVTTTTLGGTTRVAAYVQGLAGGAARHVSSDSFVPFRQVNADVDDTEGEAVAATPQAIAVASQSAEETGVAASGDASLEFGPAGGRLAEVEHCHDDNGEPTYTGAYVVSGTRLAYTSLCGPDAGAILVRDLAGPQRTVVPASATALLSALHGDELAYATGGMTHVMNLATGATTDVPATGYVGLQSDGKFALMSGPSCPRALAWYAAGSTTPNPLAGGRPCDTPVMTGDRILFRDDARVLRVADLAGHYRMLFPVVAYAAEGNGAAVIEGGCSVETLYAITLDAAATQPAIPATCPVRVRARRLRLAGSRVRVPISCPHGCDAVVALSRSASRRSRAVASAEALVIPPRRTGTAILRLGRAARAALRGGRHRRYVLITAKPGPTAPSRTERTRVAVVG